MHFNIIKDVVQLLEKFESDNKSTVYSEDIEGFKAWIYDQKIQDKSNDHIDEPYWDGKEKGRTPESVISTLLVHLNRYAKMYSKSAIFDSDFITQEDFIYLINLKAFGAMTKIELIKKNVHEKPIGTLIINRLIKHGWIEQTGSSVDKRTKVIKITDKGLEALENQMTKIRKATHIVSGNLNYSDKMELIRILNKLADFHQPIFQRNTESKDLLDWVDQEYLSKQ
ncbi:DNA-binding MarR family transcriptional regulator [Chryseobacterium ginsenosidimutans]|uniref:MarR family winged helix-turn-helix transcriptional regulator n=1 Tax=Chryseobacterium ginsenosidimutans TaxID=687846 RepID=UPI002788A016|nr:winged helix DNA-binding protein [Chryseobacterium ginsenosidimutans]MDQ0595091.1 DNA-binding MarR family transcriptional regulator [Chryseobacterium ginsenosidimutans]